MATTDFTGFTYKGRHSSTYGILRVSDGSRYSEGLVPDFDNKGADLVGVDGDLFESRRYKKTQFTLKIAFDNVTEDQFRGMRNWLGGAKLGDLVFDERPYKTYWVKLAQKPEFNYICFSKDSDANSTQIYSFDDIGERVYKGEADISFIAYDPFGYVVDRDYSLEDGYGNRSKELNDQAIDVYFNRIRDIWIDNKMLPSEYQNLTMGINNDGSIMTAAQYKYNLLIKPIIDKYEEKIISVSDEQKDQLLKLLKQILLTNSESDWYLLFSQNSSDQYRYPIASYPWEKKKNYCLSNPLQEGDYDNIKEQQDLIKIDDYISSVNALGVITVESLLGETNAYKRIYEAIQEWQYNVQLKTQNELNLEYRNLKNLYLKQTEDSIEYGETIGLYNPGDFDTKLQSLIQFSKIDKTIDYSGRHVILREFPEAGSLRQNGSDYLFSNLGTEFSEQWGDVFSFDAPENTLSWPNLTLFSRGYETTFPTITGSLVSDTESTDSNISGPYSLKAYCNSPTSGSQALQYNIKDKILPGNDKIFHFYYSSKTDDSFPQQYIQYGLNHYIGSTSFSIYWTEPDSPTKHNFDKVDILYSSPCHVIVQVFSETNTIGPGVIHLSADYQKSVCQVCDEDNKVVAHALLKKDAESDKYILDQNYLDNVYNPTASAFSLIETPAGKDYQDREYIYKLQRRTTWAPTVNGRLIRIGYYNYNLNTSEDVYKYGYTDEEKGIIERDFNPDVYPGTIPTTKTVIDDNKIIENGDMVFFKYGNYFVDDNNNSVSEKNIYKITNNSYKNNIIYNSDGTETGEYLTLVSNIDMLNYFESLYATHSSDIEVKDTETSEYSSSTSTQYEIQDYTINSLGRNFLDYGTKTTENGYRSEDCDRINYSNRPDIFQDDLNNIHNMQYYLKVADVEVTETNNLKFDNTIDKGYKFNSSQEGPIEFLTDFYTLELISELENEELENEELENEELENEELENELYCLIEGKKYRLKQLSYKRVLTTEDTYDITEKYVNNKDKQTNFSHKNVLRFNGETVRYKLKKVGVNLLLVTEMSPNPYQDKALVMRFSGSNNVSYEMTYAYYGSPMDSYGMFSKVHYEGLRFSRNSINPHYLYVRGLGRDWDNTVSNNVLKEIYFPGTKTTQVILKDKLKQGTLNYNVSPNSYEINLGYGPEANISADRIHITADFKDHSTEVNQGSYGVYTDDNISFSSKLSLKDSSNTEIDFNTLIKQEDFIGFTVEYTPAGIGNITTGFDDTSSNYPYFSNEDINGGNNSNYNSSQPLWYVPVDENSKIEFNIIKGKQPFIGKIYDNHFYDMYEFNTETTQISDTGDSGDSKGRLIIPQHELVNNIQKISTIGGVEIIGTHPVDNSYVEFTRPKGAQMGDIYNVTLQYYKNHQENDRYYYVHDIVTTKDSKGNVLSNPIVKSGEYYFYTEFAEDLIDVNKPILLDSKILHTLSLKTGEDFDAHSTIFIDFSKHVVKIIHEDGTEEMRYDLVTNADWFSIPDGEYWLYTRAEVDLANIKIKYNYKFY